MGKQIVVERDGAQKTIELPHNLIGQIVDGEKSPIVTLRLPLVVGGFQEGSPNEKTLKPRDLITSINGQPMPYMDQVFVFLENNKGKSFPATVLRDRKSTNVTIHVNAKGKLGVELGKIKEQNLEQLGYYQFNRTEYSFAESIPVGLERGKDELVGYGKQLKKIFTPSTGAYKGVGGFFAIFNIFPDQWSWEAFWTITAILSIMLGVMNLLPIPALDGGHVMFLLYEMITRRKPSDKFMEHAQLVGFVLLIGLLLFANGNDIYKAVAGK